MFVCKLMTLFCVNNYEHFHVYLAYRRQTGIVVTRQTYDRAPRLTNHTLHTFQGVLTFTRYSGFKDRLHSRDEDPPKSYLY